MISDGAPCGRTPLEVIAATEENLRRISCVNDGFVAPALNEWRYATRHMAELLENPGGGIEREKAMRHLERAYFDSSDILLTVLLDAFRAFSEDFGEYLDVVQSVMPDFSRWRGEMREARRFLLDARRGDGRFEVARRMDEISAGLFVILDEIDGNREALAARVKKERRRECRELAALLVGIVAAVAAVVALFLR